MLRSFFSSLGVRSLGLATLSLLLSGCSASGGSPEPVVTMHARMDQAFLAKAPREGERLPDAQGFDEEGRPFALSDTRGRVTVIVAGCLT
ncbi:MAG: hypothetical protein AAFZ87_12695 [Planctomycetota bacterium]